MSDFSSFIFLYSQEVISLKVRIFPYKTIIFYFIDEQKIIQELGDPSNLKVNAIFWKGHYSGIYIMKALVGRYTRSFIYQQPNL